MRTASMLIIGLLGCTKSGGSSDPVGVAPGAKPATRTELTVAITAVTLAGDCGGRPSEPAPESERKRAHDSDSDRSEQAKPACEQTSMQLSVIGAVSGEPIQLRVKRVELIDDKGNLIGELTSRTPTIWSQDGTYRPWDQLVAPAQDLSVSYALSEPRWGSVIDRWNRTYVLRAVLTIGATDRTVQRDIHLAAPAALPPDVET